jgi:DNA polymerase-4
VLVVTAADQRAFLDELAVSEIWGVGPATLGRLSAIGVRTIRDLTAVPRVVLERRFGGANGAHLHALAHGIDPRPVVPDRSPKSVGHEETYAHDLVSVSATRTEVLRLADATAARLREHHLEGRTVQLKVRYADFTTITRSRTFTAPTASARELAGAATRLLDDVDVARGVRLLGVTAANLVASSPVRHLALDVDHAGPWDATEQVVDEVRARFGPDAIAPAALLADGSIDVRRRGDQQWGRAAPDPSGAGTRDRERRP